MAIAGILGRPVERTRFEKSLAPGAHFSRVTSGRDDALEGRGAHREKLGAVVAHSTGEPPRGHPAPEPPRFFQHHYGESGPREFPRCCEPRHASPHHDHIHWFSSGARLILLHRCPPLEESCRLPHPCMPSTCAGPLQASACCLEACQPGKSIRIGSVVQGIRVLASTSPAAQPPIMPAVSARACTRG